MGNILWQFMKASPGVVGWGVGSFVWAVVVQVIGVTVYALNRYRLEHDDALFHDYVWFIYREMPSALPMIFVYSGVFVVIMLSASIFVRSGFTVGELPQAVRRQPVRVLAEVILPFVCIASIVAGLAFNEIVFAAIAVPVLASYLSVKAVGIWIDWARSMIREATVEQSTTPVAKRECCCPNFSQSE